MQHLNDIYNHSCKISYNQYKKISKDITIIDNFFEDFEKAKSFFINRDTWKCIPFQGYSKSGLESLLPGWVGRSLMERYVLDNKIKDIITSYSTIVDYRYDSDELVWSLHNSEYFPHFDSIEDNTKICLVNLNDEEISTRFYTFNDQESCNYNILKDWDFYVEGLTSKVSDYCVDYQIINRKDIKNFLIYEENNLKHKLIREVKYKKNQAIVYSANLFHSPNVTINFTKSNPRILLRTMFNIKTLDMGGKT